MNSGHEDDLLEIYEMCLICIGFVLDLYHSYWSCAASHLFALLENSFE